MLNPFIYFAAAIAIKLDCKNSKSSLEPTFTTRQFVSKTDWAICDPEIHGELCKLRKQNAVQKQQSCAIQKMVLNVINPGGSKKGAIFLGSVFLMRNLAGHTHQIVSVMVKNIVFISLPGSGKYCFPF